MTPDRPTLLEALAWGSVFGGRQEDVAVEALGHILTTSEAARAALSGVVDAGGRPVGPITSVRTQVTGPGGARPDLAACDRSGRERVLLEAKFEAGLTKNQPAAYLERLPDELPSALLFVAPAARVEWLWAQLLRRTSKRPSRGEWLRALLGGGRRKRPDGVESESFRKAGVVWIPAGGARRLMLTSWKTLLDRMQERAAAAADAQAEADIRQLRGLATHEDEDGFVPLRRAEMRPETPRRILALQRLVDAAAECALDAGWADAKGLKVQPQWWGYGRWLHLAGAQVWFGVDFVAWSRSPDTPLLLWFTPNSLRRRPRTRGALESVDPREVLDDGGGLVVPVALPLEVGCETVLEKVVARLKEVAGWLGRRRFGKAEFRGSLGPDEFPPLRRAEMRPDVPRRIPELQRLVDDATARGLHAGWADVTGFRVTVQWWGYGRYLRLAGAQAWFGVDYEDWANQPPDTPLWLWFTPNSLLRRKTTRGALEPLRGKNSPQLFDTGGGLVVPVPLPVEKERLAVLDHVVGRLEEVAELVGGTSRR